MRHAAAASVRRLVTGFSALFLLTAASRAAGPHNRPSFDFEIGIEGRGFLESPLDPRQHESGGSLRLEPEVALSSRSSHTGFIFRPFVRLDSSDSQRSHTDIRELYVYHRAGDWDLRAGVQRVFWGATEAVHLVDVINQTDVVEDPDGEDKLGQPMLEASWGRRWGTFSLFALPFFRERTFPGVAGRLRAPLPLMGDAVYESSATRRHADWALRYIGHIGPMDLGLSHFSGTSRSPRLLVSAGGSKLQPVYDLVEQTGLDATAAAGSWLWKVEAIRSRSRTGLYHAAAGGFERTATGLRDGALDLGLLLEYLWDERGRRGPSPYDNDVFAGIRLTFNDVATTQLLAGVIVDRTRGLVVNVEGSRRLSSRFSLAAELRIFSQTAQGDALYPVRRDDYVSLELVTHL